jgi:hypothetical protein
VVLSGIPGLLGKFLCFGYVRFLRLPGTSDEEENQNVSRLAKVNSVAWSVFDAEFANSFTDGFCVSEVAERETTDADLDASQYLKIAKFPKPGGEDLGLANFDHVLTIVHSLNFFKRASCYPKKRTGSEPMGMHTFEKVLSDGKPRGGADDGVNFALWAKRALSLIDPFDDVSRRKNRHAVEAPAGLTLFNLGAMITAVIVRYDVVVFASKTSKLAQESH